MSKQFIPMYDLQALTEEQKQDYIASICEHLGVPPQLGVVRLIWDDQMEGGRKQVAYALKGATDIIRDKRKINTKSLSSQMVGSSIVFTCTGEDVSGRQEIAVGCKQIEGLKGKPFDDAIMTAQTRATRRMTLQFVGGGILDESEINTATTNIATQSAPLSQLALAPQPTVKPSNEPGKDVTVDLDLDKLDRSMKEAGRKSLDLAVEFVKEHEGDREKADAAFAKLKAIYAARDSAPVLPNLPLATGTPDGLGPLVPNLKAAYVMDADQAAFQDRQKKLRDDAIAQLNSPAAQNPPNEGVSLQEVSPKKPRKPRGPNKPKVNLGPSEPVPAAQPAVQAQTATAPPKVETPVQPSVPAVQTPIVPITASTGPSKPRLTQEQVKPFRQRLFRVLNDYLEPNGFTPKEGIGNAEKMRALANMMFPDVANMNELTVEQWEKYLQTLEHKIQKEGPAATVKYIEEAIGI